MGFRASSTLLRAVELELFTKLEEAGPQTVGQVTRAVGLQEHCAQELLDTLVDLDFLEHEDGCYYNSDEAAMFLDKRKSSYVGGILSMANYRHLGFWTDLTSGLGDQAVRCERKPAEPDFAALYTDPERLAEFLASMTCVSRGANQTIARRFPWENYETWLDLGCAQGDLVVQVVLANPHIRAHGFDFGEVRPSFDEYVEAHGVAEHVTFIAGDFWTDQLPTVDVITMGHILRQCRPDKRSGLLQKVYDALTDRGVLIIYDSHLADNGSHEARGLFKSLSELEPTDSEEESFTGSDCVSMLREAGFEHSEVHHLVGAESMIVAHKSRAMGAPVHRSGA